MFPCFWMGWLALLLTFGVRIAPAMGSCTSDDWKRAVAWGDTGKGLYERDQSYAKAYENFSEAARICPSPRWLGWMARCQRQQKKLLEARDLYAEARDFSYTKKTFNEATEDFDRAKAAAQAEYDELVPRIPTVRFTFRGATVWEGALTVDDKPVAPAAGGEISLNPGEHRAALTATGAERGEKRFTLVEGDRQWIDLTAASPPPAGTTRIEDASAPARLPLPSAPPPPLPPAPPPPSRSRVPAYVLFGLGAAGVVTTAVCAGLAASSLSRFNQHPTADNADAVDRYALIGDITAGTALTFGVTGVVLLLASGTPAQTSTTMLRSKPRQIAIDGLVTPYLSPRGGGAAALFTF